MTHDEIMHLLCECRAFAAIVVTHECPSCAGTWSADECSQMLAEKSASCMCGYRHDFNFSAIATLEERLAEHAMQEVQRLGQEIEQKIGCVNHDCDQCKAQSEQEPVAWMDADGNVSDNNDHKCFPIPLYTKEQP